MGELNTPIDVISVCEASGEIRPLRFRMEDEDQLEQVEDENPVREICAG